MVTSEKETDQDQSRRNYPSYKYAGNTYNQRTSFALFKRSVTIDKSGFFAFEASSIQTSTRIPLPSTSMLQTTLNPRTTYTLETTTQMTSLKSALTPKTNILDISDANKTNKQTFEAAWDYLQTMVLVVVGMLGGLTVLVVVALLAVYEGSGNQLET